MSLLMGTSQLDITPVAPVPLAGFASRKGNMEGIHSPLYLKTFLFEIKEQKGLLFIADLIWWDTKLVQEWKQEIATRFSIHPTAVCFHATHNHSGPQVSSQFTSLLGVRDEKYLSLLQEKVFLGVEEAFKNKELVTCKWIKTQYKLGINRRKKTGGRIVMEPNFSGECDSGLTILQFEKQNKMLKAILLHYACHPTCTDSNILSSEYVGHACSIVQKHYDSSIVGFLQGCSGDIRPALIKDHLFYKGTLAEMEEVGVRFANKVISEIQTRREYKQYTFEKMESQTRIVDLEFLQDYSVLTDFSPEIINIWAAHQKCRDEEKSVDLEIQKVQIGDFILLSFNGEMVQEYGRYAKSLDERVLPIGYSNGMIGYVPTASQLNDGGYEAEEFIYYFGLPAPFQTNIEDKIKAEIKKILNGSRS